MTNDKFKLQGNRFIDGRLVMTVFLRHENTLHGPNKTIEGSKKEMETHKEKMLDIYPHWSWELRNS